MLYATLSPYDFIVLYLLKVFPSQSDKWLKQSEVIDGRVITTTDSAILWRRMSKSHIWMNLHEWLSYIEQLAEVIKGGIPEIRPEGSSINQVYGFGTCYIEQTFMVFFCRDFEREKFLGLTLKL